MKTGLGQRQVQLQKLSPQQIQLMKLLQVPTALLEQRIKEEIEVNPALEEGNSDFEDSYAEFETGADDFQQEERTSGEDEDGYEERTFEVEDYVNEYMEEDDSASYKLRGDSYQPEEEDRSFPMAVEYSFHEYLEEQIGLLDLENDRQEAIARQIIGSIDEDGYLRREPASIADDLLFAQNVLVEEEEILDILTRIQRLDPPGVGARDLQECLRIQLDNLLEQAADLGEEEVFSLQIARKLVGKYFDAFSKKHFEKLQRTLNISEEELKDAIEAILKLNPKPASGYAGGAMSRATQYVIPDFIIINRDGELDLTLNARNTPDLRISDQFREMLKSYGKRNRQRQLTNQEKETLIFVKQKIESARWFIDAIRQRQETMFHTMYAIMDYQQDYLLTGDQKKIRPMILQDIANRTGLDVSTVSRVANSKYVQTEFGTMRLKDFFSESLQTSEGEEVSTLEVKKILLEMIASEDKHHPLSDDKLTQILQEKGYNIARRTVAKYRDQLNIPKASLRKEL